MDRCLAIRKGGRLYEKAEPQKRWCERAKTQLLRFESGWEDVMRNFIVLAVICLIGQTSVMAQTAPEEDYSSALCTFLSEADRTSALSVTGRYEDKYNDFSKALSGA